MNRRAASLLIVLSLPALAACGDNAPSKADFVAKADPICKTGNEASSAFTTPTDIPGLRDFGTKLADNVDKTTKQLEELDFPKGEDGNGAKSMVKAMRDGGTAARNIGPAVDKENFTEIETTARAAVDAFKKADSDARAFGSAECGKGEAESSGRMSTSLGTTVKAAYIIKVDALCTAAQKELAALPEPETEQQAVAYFDKALAVGEKMRTEIKAIPAPVTDKDKLDAWFAAGDASIAKTRATREAAAGGDEDKFVELAEQSAQAGLTAAGKASAYGLKACGTEAAS